ncbi:DUF3558 domain-containing protein [Nocardia sp. NBC_00508]|uniref:DUF3558 domain-containing protein n=1 Tax=Nocardia sp. NBC_00508 TaxID=2975992 RepID=UPI002E8246D3|nr:DUF3558 domain-containing protein [Nocardia sp. NBC_00508]WUD64479.1 DUF3558 domain-containing protein [Nocardia sp. NBC_00508]
MLLTSLVASGAVACGDTTSGTPTISTTAAKALFDPCTGIPDDALRAAGVNPATEEPGIAGVHQSGWEICGWKGSKYFITVYSTGRTVSEVESKPGNVEFKDVAVAGREGRQFRVEGAAKYLECDVVFPASQGVLQLGVTNRAGQDDLEDPCTVLHRAGESIVPVLPR